MSSQEFVDSLPSDGRRTTVDALEVDFVAENGDDRIDYQVAASIMDESAFDRESASLKKFPTAILNMS